MVASIVTKVLNSVLGSYLENLDTDNLNISFLKGQAELNNLCLKPNVLDALHVPFELQYGHVGNLFLDIPMINIASAPLKIRLNNIFLLITVKGKEKWKAKEEIEAYNEGKKSILSAYEEIQETNAEIKNQSTIMDKLKSTIIDNIQVTISNLYIRISDTVSDPRNPFSISITLKELSVRTTDENWKNKFITGQNITYKVLEISDFAIAHDCLSNYRNFNYPLSWELERNFNYKKFSIRALKECEFEYSEYNDYLLPRLSIRCNVTLSKDYEYLQIPSTNVAIIVGLSSFKEDKPQTQPLLLKINDTQYKSLMKFLEHSDLYSRFKEGVLKPYSLKQYSQSEKIMYNELYSEITTLKDKKYNAESPIFLEIVRKIDEFEMPFPTSRIIIERKAARKRLRFERKHKLSLEKKSLEIKSYAKKHSSTAGSIKHFIGMKNEGKEMNQKDIENYSHEMDILFEEQLEKDKEELKKELNDIDQGVNHKLKAKKSQTIALRLNLQISQVNFILKEGNKDLLKFELNDTNMIFEQGDELINFEATFSAISILDTYDNNSIYKYIIETNIPKKKKKQLTTFKFKQEGKKSNIVLDWSNQLHLCAKINSLLYIINLLKPNPENMKNVLGNSEEIYKYIDIEDKHRKEIQKKIPPKPLLKDSLGLNIDLVAPIITIPYLDKGNQYIVHQSLLIIELGHYSIKSKIVERSEEIEYNMITDGHLLYDVYEIEIENAQVLIVNKRIENIFNWEREEEQTHLLSNLSANLQFAQCILTHHPLNLPDSKINIIFPEIIVTASDAALKYLIELKEYILFMTSTSKIEEEKDEKKEEINIKEEEEEIEEKVISTHDLNMDIQVIKFQLSRQLTESEIHSQQYADMAKNYIYHHPMQKPIIPMLELSIKDIEIKHISDKEANSTLKLSIWNILATDKQVIYELKMFGDKKTSIPKQVVSNDFKHMIGNPEMHEEEKQRDKYMSVASSEMFYDALEETEENNQKCPQIELTLETNNNTTTINFYLHHLRFILALPTLTYIYKLQIEILHFMNTREKMLLTHRKELESFHHEIQLFEQQITQRTILSNSLLVENNKSNDEVDAQPLNASHSQIIYKSIYIEANLSDVQLWIPQNTDMDQHRVFALQFDNKIIYSGKNLIEQVKLRNKLIKEISIEEATECVINLTQLSIIMLNKHVEMKKSKLPRKEQILFPSRITIINEGEFKIAELENINDTRIHIEPIDIRIGLREIDFIKTYSNNITQIFDNLEKLSLTSEEEEYQNEKKMITGIEAAKSVISADTKIGQNISFSIQCDYFKIQFQDDTNNREYPLFLLNIPKLNFSLHKYLLPQYIINEAIKVAVPNLLLHLKDAENPEEKPFNNIHAIICLEAYFYNLRISAFEPVIEPWTLQLDLFQSSPHLIQKFKIIAPQLININVTYGMGYVLSELLRKLNESEKDWKSEVQFEEIKTYESKESSAFTETMTSENSGFIFVNKLGLCMNMWVQTVETENCIPMSAHKFVLKEGSDIFMENRQLNDIRRGQFTTQYTSQKYERSKMLHINLKVEGYKTIYGLPIEITGERGFILTEKTVKRIKGANSGKLGQKVGAVVNIYGKEEHYVVELESCLMIANNTDKIIKVAPIRVDIHNISKDSLIAPHLIKDIYQISPGHIFNVPINWVIKKCSIAYIHMKDQICSFKCLFQGIDKCFKEISSNENRILEMEMNGKECVRYISCDITEYECTPKLPKTPHQYLITLNPILTIHNLIPAILNITQEIRNSQMNIQLSENEQIYYYGINPYKHYADSTFNLQIPQKEGCSYFSTKLNFQKSENEKAILQNNGEIEFHLESNTGEEIKSTESEFIGNNKIIIQADLMSYSHNKSMNNEFRTEFKRHMKSQKLIFYPKYILINHTNLELYIGKDSKLKRVIEPFKSIYFHAFNHSKIHIKTINHGWSKPFDISTIGLTGALNLKPEDYKSKKELARDTNSKIPYQYKELGIEIESGVFPYKLTTLVHFVPRYILINKLSYPIQLIQELHGRQITTLNSEERIYYNFENAKDKTNKKIKIRSEGDGKFSSSFHIEDIEDFQVQFQLQLAGEEKSRKLVQSVKYKQEKRKKCPTLDSLWWKANEKNLFLEFVRVCIVSPNEAAIFVVFEHPKHPEFEIENDTNYGFLYHQLNTDKEPDIINPFTTLPFAWTDCSVDKPKLEIIIQGERRKCAFHKIQKLKNLVIKNDTILLEVKNIGFTRVLILHSEKILAHGGYNLMNKEIHSAILNIVNKRVRIESMEIKINLEGIGLSIVNNSPKDLLYMSAYHIKLFYKQHSALTGGITTKTNEYSASIQHIQIDNMLNVSFPIILTPKQLLHKHIDEKNFELGQSEGDVVNNDKKGKLAEECCPFIQFNFLERIISEKKAIVKQYPIIQLSIQEIILSLDQEILIHIISLVMQITQLFGDRDVDAIRHINTDNMEVINRLLSVREIWEIIPKSQAIEVQEPDTYELVNADEIYIKMMNFGALKIVITLRIDQKEFDIASGVFSVFSIFKNVGAAMANITESPIYFKELIICESFNSFQNFTQKLIKNYQRQGMMQIYKILGSSDLIGNPIGLIDKLGSGVLEFFNEPRKGMLKGPGEFAVGLSQGVKGLVSNIVAGGFESVSRITGSLYSIAKSIGGDKVPPQRTRKGDNVVSGTYEGLKDASKELYTGITGIFTKPFKGAKEHGAKGFVKGLGKGLFGAIASPITAVLTATTSLTKGITNTAKWLGGAREHLNGRFRFPRYINAKHQIAIYNEELALLKMLLFSVKNGKFSSQSIEFHCLISEHIEHPIFLLITDQLILCLKGIKKTKIVFQIHRGDVVSLRFPNNRIRNKFTVIISVKNGNKHQISLSHYESIHKIYYLLYDHINLNRKQHKNI